MTEFRWGLEQGTPGADRTGPRRGVSYIGSYDTPDVARGVTVRLNTAFVSDGFAGVRILDISDFTSVLFADHFETGNTAAWQ